MNEDEERRLEVTLQCLAKIPRCTGNERVHDNGVSLDMSVLDFWKWGGSDLVTNTERGKLAEFLVARALNVPLTGVRHGAWSPIDLITPEEVTVQVKSAAYVQSWYQKSFSTIEFDIEKKRGWDLATNTWTDKRRHADVYVFALLMYKDKTSIDPLNIAQWRFFVLPTWLLDFDGAARRKSS